MAKILIGNYEATIYPEGKGFTGAVDLGAHPDGTRNRLKRKGRNQSIVKDKLRKALDDLDKGVKAERNYTVERAVNDFLTAFAMTGKSTSTNDTYRRLVNHQIIPMIGRGELRELTADDVEKWLTDRAEHLTTQTLAIVHGLLRRAIRRAMRHDKVGRNVAELVDTPQGQEGRKSKSLSLEQTAKVLKEAAKSEYRLGAYVIVAITTGLRTEEMRQLKWSAVDLDAATVYVVRADRHKGETKTVRSRRGLGLADPAVEALRALKASQAAERLKAGESYQDNDLVFCCEDGTPYTAGQVRDGLRKILNAVGIDGQEWTTRELRHTFVSVLSDHDVPAEKISQLVGHTNTRTTETVYRHQLKPEIRDGAEHMNDIFRSSPSKSA